MQFVYRYPDVQGVAGDMLDPGPIDEVAVAAERAGFDAIAFTEHPAPGARWLGAGGHQTLDPFVALSFAAAATERIQLLTYVCVLPYRNPMLVAKTAASIDRLSGGRFILGVGTGYLKGEFSALGVAMEERNELFDEALEVLPLHWSGEEFSYAGRHFSAKGTLALPPPPQQPIPIWIGGNSALTRRRVAERAQGWMPLVLPPEMMPTVRTASPPGLEQLAEQIARMRDVAAARGATIDVACQYKEPSLQTHPGRDMDAHREAIAALEHAGANWIVITGLTSQRSATLEFMEAFAEDPL